MALFKQKSPPTQPPTPATRIIPALWPDFYESIHQRLVSNGGSDSAQDIAIGVGNAIFNKGMQFLTATYEARAARDFETLYASRHDGLVADQMIDFLVTQWPQCQGGEGGWLATLITRLDDVLSRPA